jgi:hypothetical protein
MSILYDSRVLGRLRARVRDLIRTNRTLRADARREWRKRQEALLKRLFARTWLTLLAAVMAGFPDGGTFHLFSLFALGIALTRAMLIQTAITAPANLHALAHYPVPDALAYRHLVHPFWRTSPWFAVDAGAFACTACVRAEVHGWVWAAVPLWAAAHVLVGAACTAFVLRLPSPAALRVPTTLLWGAIGAAVFSSLKFPDFYRESLVPLLDIIGPLTPGGWLQAALSAYLHGIAVAALVPFVLGIGAAWWLRSVLPGLGRGFTVVDPRVEWTVRTARGAAQAAAAEDGPGETDALVHPAFPGPAPAGSPGGTGVDPYGTTDPWKAGADHPASTPAPDSAAPPPERADPARAARHDALVAQVAAAWERERSLPAGWRLAQAGWGGARAARLLPRRLRAVADALLPQGITSPRLLWMIATLSLVAVVVRCMDPEGLGSLLPALGSLLLCIGVAQGGWRGLTPTEFSVQTLPFAYAPITYSDIACVRLTVFWLCAATAAPAVFSAIFAMDHHDRLPESTVAAGKVMLLPMMAAPAFIVMQLSALTNDTANLGCLSALIAIVVLVSMGVMVALGIGFFNGGLLLCPLCGLGLFAVPLVAMALYGRAWDRGAFDLVAKKA